jgi:hypothetical protein
MNIGLQRLEHLNNLRQDMRSVYKNAEGIRVRFKQSKGYQSNCSI